MESEVGAAGMEEYRGNLHVWGQGGQDLQEVWRGLKTGRGKIDMILVERQMVQCMEEYTTYGVWGHG